MYCIRSFHFVFIQTCIYKLQYNIIIPLIQLDLYYPRYLGVPNFDLKNRG